MYSKTDWGTGEASVAEVKANVTVASIEGGGGGSILQLLRWLNICMGNDYNWFVLVVETS